MINPDDLVHVMAKFKKANGFGVDGISSFFLKIGMPILAPVLWDILNWSLAYKSFKRQRIELLASLQTVLSTKRHCP